MLLLLHLHVTMVGCIFSSDAKWFNYQSFIYTVGSVCLISDGIAGMWGSLCPPCSFIILQMTIADHHSSFINTAAANIRYSISRGSYYIPQQWCRHNGHHNGHHTPKITIAAWAIIGGTWTSGEGKGAGDLGVLGSIPVVPVMCGSPEQALNRYLLIISGHPAVTGNLPGAHIQWDGQLLIASSTNLAMGWGR
jgi:hypothetical protein